MIDDTASLVSTGRAMLRGIPRFVIVAMLSILLVVLFITSQPLLFPAEVQTASALGEKICRFNITVPGTLTGFEGKFPEIRVNAYMNWGYAMAPSSPNGADFFQVLRTRDDLYPGALAAVPTVVPANPGSFWIIGNEPDTTYGNQDSLLPETYADRYYVMATAIRSHDPTARIGFGSIVQPTPIRLRYLDRAWIRLIELTGSQSAASDLIDFWNTHAFILNEQNLAPGTGIPPGFAPTDPDAESHSPSCADGDCIDMTIFSQRIVNFRQWLADRGERGKPVWITEYGNLFPEYYIPAADTATFMTNTFDYLRAATDASTGYPNDGNHLVQGWFWHSLNNNPEDYGGNLYEDDYSRNTVGDAFVAYVTPLSALADPFPANLTAISARGTDYSFTITIANQGDAPFTGGYSVELFNGDPDSGGVQLGSTIVQPLDMRGCGEFNTFSLTASMTDQTPWDLYVQITPTVPGSDSNTGNNKGAFLGFRPQTFVDTPPSHFFWGSIERLYADGFVAGCSSDPLLFCPDNTLTRAEGAVFVERGVHGASHDDPPPPSVQVFMDVPLMEWYANWVDGLWNDGYTAGCNIGTPEVDLLYCPLAGNSRAEGAVFYLRMLHGPSYNPPDPAVQIFDDVIISEWYAKWVHQAHNDGLIDPCQETPSMLFCPDDPMTRGLAADVMVRAKFLTPLP